MTEEETLYHLDRLFTEQDKQKRKLGQWECYSIGLRFYQCRQDCKKHGHPFRLVGSSNCPDCADEYNFMSSILGKLERSGQIGKKKIGNRNYWYAIV